MQVRTNKITIISFGIAIILVVFAFWAMRSTGLDAIIADRCVNANYSQNTEYFNNDKMPKGLSGIKYSDLLVTKAYAGNVDEDAKNIQLIKNANIRFKAIDYEKNKSDIKNIVKLNNAYIASEQENTNDYRYETEMEIRTPSNNFDNLTDKIVSYAEKIDFKRIDTRDVTEEYVDIAARLNAKKRIEDEYLTILKRAANVKDILEVEEKLGKIREEIETTQGKLNLLNNQIIYSTIKISFYKEFSVIAKTNQGILTKFASGFIGGWNGFVGLLIALCYLWPVYIFLGVGVVIVKKTIKKNI